MLKYLVGVLSIITLSFAVECNQKVSISQVENTATSYVGNITSVKLSKSKSGECYYRVYGERGYVVIDAQSGELLKFTKKREK